MRTFNVYPKEGEMFTLNFYRFTIIGDGQGFWLYNDKDEISNEGFLSFDNVAAIVPVKQTEEGMIRFNVHLKNKPPFPVFANSFDTTDYSVAFRYQQKDMLRRILNEWPTAEVYVALSEVVAILPSDGLVTFRE